MKDTATISTRLMSFYASFSSDSLDNLGEIYDEKCVFIDPVHKVCGLDKLHTYFDNIMKSTLSCTFDFSDPLVSDGRLCLTWVMNFSHPKLKRGETVRVEGVSVIELSKSNGKIIMQQDYYDMGAMIYEHIPIMGGIINKIKNRLK